MLTINVQKAVNDERLNGSLNGKAFNVPFTKDLYDKLKDSAKSLETIEEVSDFDAWTESVQSILDGTDQGDVITSACQDLMVDNATGKYYLIADGKTSKVAVPQRLVDVILESVEKEIDATPIIKAWTKFLRNVNFTEAKAELFAQYITALTVDSDELNKLIEDEGYTYDKAVDRATYNDVAITQEGLIVTKKYAKLLTEGWTIDKETNKAVKTPLFVTTKSVDQFSGEVTEKTDMPEFAEELTFEPPMQARSGNAFSCHGIGEDEPKLDHVVRVGKIHRLKDWSQVNTNDHQSCVPGLHVGRLSAA